MQNSTVTRRRSSALKALVLVGAALVLSGYAWRDAAGQYYESVSPGAAPWPVASANSAIPVKLVDVSVQGAAGDDQPKSMPVAEVRKLAIAALRDAPLNSAAVRLLNGVTQFAPGVRFDRQTLLASERITRRDQITELSLVAVAGQRGDAATAMLHVDRLLTVRPSLISEILPQLIAFTRQDELRAMLIEKEDRPWYPAFINQAISGDPQPQYIAGLVKAMDPKDPIMEELNLERLAGQLALTGQYDEAIAMAARRGVSASSLAAFTPNEENTLPDLAPLTWRFANQAEASATLAEQGWVDVDMGSGKQIALMERVVKLSPGTHTLSTAFRDTGTIDGLWRWQMRCNSSGKWEVRWQSDWTKFSEGDKDLTINVPSTCPEQELGLVASLDGRGNEIFSVRAKMQ